MSDGPLVIGGTGGSGTRLFAGLAQSAGIQMGTLLNESQDQLEIAAYFDRWINRWLTEGPACETLMRKELSEIMDRHRADPAARWGWKEPRSIFLLEFLDRTFDGMRFLHVVRDGRDMAFSTNQNQLREHGEAVLGSPGGIEPRRSIELWARVNLRACDYGVRMGPRYLRLRFEDLLADPGETAARMASFLGAAEVAPVAGLGLKRPESVGAWRSRDRATIEELERIAAPALSTFGYI